VRYFFFLSFPGLQAAALVVAVEARVHDDDDDTASHRRRRRRSKLRERERWRQGFADTTGDVAEKRVLRSGTDEGGKLEKKDLYGKHNHRRFQAVVVVDVVAGTGAEPN
jgi:uncharacterized protein YheU (UPF0270 family)